jgi:hypothetical protein
MQTCISLVISNFDFDAVEAALRDRIATCEANARKGDHYPYCSQKLALENLLGEFLRETREALRAFDHQKWRRD